ncbi:MAG: serine/threonine-protein kinase [Oscillatoriaceae bacterium SKW80]|nr:serine/threonine-protein kinase [Oscillatoriaceae bacterium SKYG93]MCX8119753.1 serine/threonine-protein kinase [Oscillatoriaceae bacterium SKW80]MDW8452370.1 serine/threonine-protein kinase [Oscillatoriaceae cyanobacterium SKYGB_i_bin93]HIK27657.1 tetratricopeptide repeat protein [Oscillatoriaceae cyanobacterium M7585_C2015_266]
MIGKLLDRRYRIVKFLGSGSFGHTYLAIDTRRPGNPQCVIKHILPKQKEPKAIIAARRRFLREAQILEKLGKHDQIPMLLAYFESKQEFCLVEEFIPGHSLDSELVPGQPLSEDEVICLLQEVLEILVFVHGQQVIHRDVTPKNLIRRASDAKLVLIDFGAVKEITGEWSEGQSTRTIATGTPAYMPLEQFRGHPQFNSDIYALGAIAIQALTGVTAKELPKLKKSGGTPWRARAQVSQQLADIIDKMVHDDYTQRYQSAKEVLEDLRKIIATSEESQPPPTILYFPQTPPQLPGLGLQYWWYSELADSLLRRLAWIGVATVVSGGLFLAFQNQTYIKARELAERGARRALAGDHLGAIDDYTQALILSPNNAELYNNRGKARYALNDADGAVEDYSRAIQINPNNADAYENRCIAKQLLQRFEEALSDCTRTIQLQPERFTAYKNRCSVYFQLGAMERALADCSRAIELNPNDAGAYANRGMVLNTLKREREALADLTRALELMPKNAEFYKQRGTVYFRLGDYQNAIADFSQALQLNPNDAGAWSNRGSARYNLGQFQEAIADFTRALALVPDSEATYYNRGKALAHLGDKSRAKTDFQKAAQLCLDKGLTVCYNNSQFEIQKLQ